MAGSVFEKVVLRSMGMDDATWARHANPWSVWTRVPIGPAMLLAIWSHVLIGWRTALLLLALLSFWAWVNPRAFAPPRSVDSWASRGTLGERIWLARREAQIPRHHARAAAALAAITALSFLIGIAAAILGNLSYTLLGAATSLLAKMWFVDRMVWLHEDMRRSSTREKALQCK